MANLSRADLAHRPAPGKWSIKEIICHLADVEVVNGWRYRMILAQSGSNLTAFDQDLWASQRPIGGRTRRWPWRPSPPCAAGI